MAVPTIFTLAEDALGRVPRSLKEASAALGASRLQTTREVVPARPCRASFPPCCSAWAA
jgi:phosphate transport system permease protein